MLLVKTLYWDDTSEKKTLNEKKPKKHALRKKSIKSTLNETKRSIKTVGDEWTWVFCLLSHRSTQRRHHRESKPSSRGTSFVLLFLADFSDFLVRLRHYRTSQFHLCYNFHFHLLDRKSWSLQPIIFFCQIQMFFSFFSQWVWLWNESIKHFTILIFLLELSLP